MSRKGHWGTGAIKTILILLRQELPGLKGFSETSIKDMRIFFEEWKSVFENRQSVTADLESSLFPIGEFVINRQLTTADLTTEQLELFLMCHLPIIERFCVKLPHLMRLAKLSTSVFCVFSVVLFAMHNGYPVLYELDKFLYLYFRKLSFP